MKQNTLGYKVKQYLMFAGPGTILFLAVVIVPFLYGLYLTLTSWNGTSPQKDFVGFQNFANAFKDTTYWQAMGRTAIYSAFAVVLINIRLCAGLSGYQRRKGTELLPRRLLRAEPDRRYRPRLCVAVCL